MRILVTGGCGFIGSHFINLLFESDNFEKIVNIDFLNYAANIENIKEEYRNSRKYSFYNVNICDYSKVFEIIESHKIEYVIHFAAETHVDKSINCSRGFIESNVVGTDSLLRACVNSKTKILKFIHVSTDEVFGDIPKHCDHKFSEKTAYNPKNPYAASKASSDFLVKAYGHTYNLPFVITNCGNNFGENQDLSKFIPVCISKLLNKKLIPIYGDGQNVRDWIYVEDHCAAILSVLTNENVNKESFCIGANNLISNIDLVKKIHQELNLEFEEGETFHFVKDRKGHDFKYSIDNSKILSLGWKPKRSFEENLKRTIKHYEKNNKR